MSRNGSSFHAAADNLETLRVSEPVDKSLWKRESFNWPNGPHFVIFHLIYADWGFAVAFPVFSFPVLSFCLLPDHCLLLWLIWSVTTFGTLCGKIWPETRRSPGYGWIHIQNPNDSVKANMSLSLPTDLPLVRWRMWDSMHTRGLICLFLYQIFTASSWRQNEAENKNGNLGCMKLDT